MMHLWNCSSWLMPVKRPVQEELLVRHNYTVEMCFAVDSLLINLWRDKSHFIFVSQVSFLTCRIPSRLKWTKEDPFLQSWLLLLCVEQVYIFSNFTIQWLETSKSSWCNWKVHVHNNMTTGTNCSMGSYDQHTSFLFCYNNNTLIAWLHGFFKTQCTCT